MKIFFKVLFLFLSYFIGSIPFGVIFGKIKGIDIRKIGSGNTGAANTGRALGKKFAFLTFFLDMLKGALFVILFRYKIISSEYLILDPSLYGFLAMLGHSFSIFINFKGGKAVATGAGFIFAYLPLTIPFGLFSFYLIVKKTKIASISSLCTTLLVTIISIIFTIIGKDFITSIPISFYFGLFSSFACVLIFIMHIPNIKRIINKQENKV